MPEEPTLIVEKRKVYRIGGSLMIALPPAFTRIHKIKEGDEVPVLAKHILKIVPMSEAVGYDSGRSRKGSKK